MYVYNLKYIKLALTFEVNKKISEITYANLVIHKSPNTNLSILILDFFCPIIPILYPIRNLSSWQLWEWLVIIDYGRSCLEMPMKQENLELVIVDYPRNFLYWKLNYKRRWSSSAFPSVPNMFVKVAGIPGIFDDC